MEVSGQLHGLAALLPGMTLVLGGLEGYRGGLNLFAEDVKMLYCSDSSPGSSSQ
jgi:hypothetical protein